MRIARVLVSVVVLALGIAAVPVGTAWAIDPSCGNQAAFNDPIVELPWAQQMYDPANKLWPYSKGFGVTVAVLDTGVDATHPQLQSTVLPGYDFFRNVPAGDIDCVPHGTAVASIISAQSVPGYGFAGLAPGAQILPVRLSEGTHISPSDELLSPAVLAAGIDFAVNSGADVIAVTEVTYADDPVLADAVYRAISAGRIVVAAVGDGHDTNSLGDLRPTPFASFPAAYDGVIGVGAVGIDGGRAPTSQIGSYVDLVAPGLDVTAAAFGGHSSFNGTSIAAGFVAAAVALMLGHPDAELRSLVGLDLVGAVSRRLLATADGSIGLPQFGYGAGLLDPYRAMTETVTVNDPAAIGGRQAPPRDIAAENLAAERAAANTSALRTVAILAGLGVLVVTGFLIVPRARRRGWRSGRDREGGPDSEDKLPEWLPGEMLFQPPVERAGRN